MNRLIRLACPIVVVLCVSIQALGETKSGKCTLREAGAFDDEKHVVVKVGEKVKGTCSFYIDEFFGKKIVNANIKIENTTDNAMFCEYHVAFFDKNGNLVGCASQGTMGDDGLGAGKETLLGSCLITVPKDKLKRIASYKVTFYESDTPIGKME